jgi:hypothetical protein
LTDETLEDVSRLPALAAQRVADDAMQRIKARAEF